MEQRVRVNDGLGAVGRSVPIPHFLIAATTLGGADVVYTVQPVVTLEVQRLTVTNTSGSAVTFSLHTVPDGGAAGTENTEIPAVSIAANTVSDITDYVGGLYTSETTFQAFAGTTNVLVIHGWAKEIL